MDEARPDADEVYHYAACNDCPLFSFEDSEQDAAEAAKDHQRRRAHDTYHDTMEAIE